MRVGWRLTRVARRDANSEYLLRTSKSLKALAKKTEKLCQTYTNSDCVRNVTAPTFIAFPCIGNQDLKILILA